MNVVMSKRAVVQMPVSDRRLPEWGVSPGGGCACGHWRCCSHPRVVARGVSRVGTGAALADAGRLMGFLAAYVAVLQLCCEPDAVGLGHWDMAPSRRRAETASGTPAKGTPANPKRTLRWTAASRTPGEPNRSFGRATANSSPSGGTDGIVVDVRDATREHRSGSARVAALDGVSLQMRAGEALAVVGPSGAGKTTLLNLIGGLDRPTSGTVTVHGHELTAMRERALTRFRACYVGMVFQDSYLLSGLTALENVAVAGMRWGNRRAVMSEAARLLQTVGLGDRMDFPPSRLSGGERQRVGVARAMIGDRPLLVADEPTGNLDAKATSELLDLFEELRNARGVALVVATHDPLVADRIPSRLRLDRGRPQP